MSNFSPIVIIKVLTHLEHSIESHFLLQELVIGVSPVAEQYVGTASCSFDYIAVHLNLLQKRSKPLGPSPLSNILPPLATETLSVSKWLVPGWYKHRTPE